jgi:hypothetical protein
MRIELGLFLTLGAVGCSANETFEPVESGPAPGAVSATIPPTAKVDWSSDSIPSGSRGVDPAKPGFSARARLSPLESRIPSNEYVSFGGYSPQRIQPPVFDDCDLYTITSNPELERVEYRPAVWAKEGTEATVLGPVESGLNSSTGARLHHIPE